MTSICWKSAVTWSLLGLMFLLFILMWGPAPALAGDYDHPDLVLYEVTEDMYLVARHDKTETYVNEPSLATHRQAVAQLSGTAKLGTPLCPREWVKQVAPKAKHCTINAKGADDLSLATGKGTLSGVFAVVVQGDNKVDAPEFVIMTGSFYGYADLSLAMAGQAPIGFITNGKGTIDGYDDATPSTFTFSGTFRLPFAIDENGRSRWGGRYLGDAYYLGDNQKPVRVKSSERSLGWPTVRLDIEF